MAGSGPSLQVLGVPVTIDLEGMGERAVVERFGPGGMEADVIFKAPYNRRFDVIKGLLGGSVGAGKTLTYWKPIRYPPLPQLFCTSIGDCTGIKPFTDNLGWVNYKYVRIPAHFSVPTWDAIPGLPTPDPSGIERTTTRFRVSSEVFSPPIGSYYYIGGAYNGNPVAASSQSVMRSKVEVVMTRHLMPFVPLAASLRYTGTVNDAPLLLADYLFPRGCVLFTGIDTDPTSDPSTGVRAWDVPFTFVGNYVIEWNALMDPGGQWRLVNDKKTGAGNFPFSYTSFPALFGNTF